MSPQPHRERRKPNPVIDVTIDRIVGDGKGIGFTKNNTVFVSRTAPGDVVRTQINRKQKSTLHGTVRQVLTPSPMRIEPACPYYDRCGGCDLMHIDYANQLETKKNMIVDSLRRIAKLEVIPDFSVTPSPNEWNYRSRAEFQTLVPDHIVGYFQEGSRTIVDVENCPIATDTVNALLTTLRDDVANGLVPETAKEYRAVGTDYGSALEQTSTQTSSTLQQTVGDHTYRFSAECFFQANIPIADRIVHDVMAIADQATSAGPLSMDLYAGVGLFSVPLGTRFERVIAVENFKPAIPWLDENLKRAEIKGAKVIEAQVERWVSLDQTRHGRVGMLVFDPPRAGAGPQAIDGIVRLKPAHIAAVSCDPATFSRDLKGLLDGGYELVSLQAYDMFPQTHHVELMAHLARKQDA